VVEPTDNSKETDSNNLSLPTGEGIVIDIGTGDGSFVFQSARQNPRKFFIGIDANPRPLEKISEKVHRKPTKGGLPNVLFLQAAVEELPTELDGVADEVHIHFPWGSLLLALMFGDYDVLCGLRRICSPGALLEIAIGLDQERDKAELERLDLTFPNLEYFQSVLPERYRRAGFEITETGTLPPTGSKSLQTSWAKRLAGNQERQLTYIVGRASSSGNSP
jgi:16S rRNA (adenine(1408)-N(1))-methyltransferase